MNDLKTPVSEARWAQSAAGTMHAFTESLPAVHASNIALWQHRVDRGAETPFVPHVSLFSIEALEYSRQDDNGKGHSAPTGKKFAFLVVGGDRRAACDKVRAQLSAHGFDPLSFALFSLDRLLILA